MPTAPLLLVLVLVLVPPAEAGPDPLEAYDTLLARYVTPEGVRYEAWRADATDVEALSAVVTTLASTAPASLAPPERFALYINLYNAKVVELVLEHAPTRSIREIDRSRFGYGVFFKKWLEFDGSTISLNALEKRLREESGDPRIHFAINCGSRSCPALADEAYRADRLDAQLERQSRAALETPRMLSWEAIGRKPRLLISVSKIFDWFAKDFKSSDGVEGFLGRYGPPELASELQKPAARVEILYMEYDWSLNGAP
jgi:hypothetical protein